MRVAGVFSCPSDFTVSLCFADKFLEIIKAVGIKKAQARKVARHSELFRSCGQKQQSWDFAAESFGERVFITCRLRRPPEMMSFVYDKNVPPGSERLLNPSFATGE